MLILEALWFFLPILVANQCPGLAARLSLPAAHTPVSSRLLGAHKTVAAYYAGPLGALVTVYLQRLMHEWSAGLGVFDYDRSDLWLIGLAFGAGAVLGDHAKSFAKRCSGIPAGAPWWPFDQLDFAIGGVVATVPFVGWIGWERAVVIVVFVLIIHPIGNRVGYALGLRKVPW